MTVLGNLDEPFMQFLPIISIGLKSRFSVLFFGLLASPFFRCPNSMKVSLRKDPLPVLECINYTGYGIAKVFDKVSKSEWF